MKPASSSAPTPSEDEAWLAGRVAPLWEAPHAAGGRALPPFAHVAAPLVAAAWRDLAAALPPAWLARLEPTARDDLRAHALTRLCAALAPALHADWFRDRPAGEALFLRLAPAAAIPTAGVHRYAAYCRTLAEPAGWAAWLDRHPAAPDLIAVLRDHWRDATRELLQRLASDAPALARTWGLGPETRLRRIEPGAGDPHAGGRTVVRLTFATAGGERRLAYKPRDLRLDARWSHLLAAAFDGAATPPTAAEVLPVGASHGYVAWIEPAPPADPPAYFRQAGRLLALAQLTGLSDLHHENIVPTAAGPVAIDLETLFTPPQEAPADPELQPVLDSVLHVGLLPVLVVDREGAGWFDPSGLGHDPGARAAPAWRYVNTDAMVPRSAGRRGATGSRPAAPLAEHLPDLLAGYREAWRAWREPARRVQLAAELAACRGLVRRRIVRPTRIYAALLAEATAPAALRSPAVRTAIFQRLAATRSPSPLVGEEIAALGRHDIPRFTAIVGEEHDPGLARAEARLAGGDEAWLAWQEAIARALGTARAPAAWPPVADPAAAAQAVRDELLARRTRNPAGRPCWLGRGAHPRGDLLLPEVPGERWNDGEPGLAAFLTLWVRHHPEDTAARTVLAATLAGLRTRWADDPARTLIAREGPGYAGLGGILRWLDWLATTAADGHAAALRDRWLSSLTPADLTATEGLDFMTGLAGLAGPLARREHAVPCPRRRTLLARLGERLRAAQGPDGAWLAPDLSRPLAGLSHGASGIGLALIEIGVALGDETLIDAGAAGFAFEETVFDVATGNWRDLRPDVPAGPGMASWCHGAPGIGLARLRALQVAPDHRDAPQWRDALDRALRHTAAQPLGPHDFVCCGNLGRAWILRTAGAVLAASVWIAEADRITAATTARPGPPGFSHATGLPPLGFHVGLAGIGLAWLQHGRAAPDPIDALLL